MTMAARVERRRRPPPPRKRATAPAAVARPATSSVATPAENLRTRFAAARVSFTWLGVRKALSGEQRAVAAEQFGAEGRYLSAAKKLLDTRHDAFRRLTAVRGRTLAYWKGNSLPYPEPGLRLLRQDDLSAFDRRMQELRRELSEAVENLEGRYAELKDAARRRLGSLYSEGDYPPSLAGLFAVEWDFPAVEPPEYLLRLKPELYEQERRRIAARFDEAVALAERAFVAEFQGLVAHLVERLSPAGPEGKRKVFRDSAVVNLAEFFDRFRHLSVGSSPELERLVETAKAAVAGRDAKVVREGEDALRREMSRQLTEVRLGLDRLLVDAPRRRVLRPPRSDPAMTDGGPGSGEEVRT